MAFNNGPKIVTDGLVMCLDASDRNSYPGSGTTWYDVAGNNNGTLTNGPTFNSTNGGSIVFDGADDYISDTITGLPTGASARTVNIWVKITGTPSSNPYFGLCGYGAQSTANTFDLGYIDATGKVFLDVYGAGGIQNTSSLSKNIWYMITGIYTGTTLQLYINGILENSNTYVINTSNSAFKLGVITWGYPAPLIGNISNAQIYNKALSSTEVLQNYNATKSRFNLT
jgi:hypothetical protein